MFGRRDGKGQPRQRRPATDGSPAVDLSRDGRPQKAVATFHTTSDAMAFEANARASGLAGRLTTIPRQITAGCGYAWTFSLDQHDLSELLDAMDQAGLDYEGVYLL